METALRRNQLGLGEEGGFHPNEGAFIQMAVVFGAGGGPGLCARDAGRRCLP